MIVLPASNADVLAQAVNPALAVLPARMTDDRARVMELAIGRQESGFSTREQVNGPARGFWQFERNGVLAVMNAPSTGEYAFQLCQALEQTWGSNAILNALSQDDVLAAGFARLLLWSDPRRLPSIGDAAGAWDLYERCWRPGKPDYTRWRDDAYPAALETMRAAA